MPEPSATERSELQRVDTGERPMPPVRTADERTMLVATLDWYREGVLHKVHAMRQHDAVATRLPSPTTAAGLVKHLALVEDFWFTVNLARSPVPDPWVGIDFEADPEWEFRTAREEPLEDSVRLYEQACARSRTVTAARALDDTGTSHRGSAFSLRWLLLHMVEETARHLGHLDILRELADGTTGD